MNEQIYSNGEIYKFTNKVKKVVIQESAGYISKEYAYIYPPGIPLIVPGERISEGTVRQIICIYISAGNPPDRTGGKNFRGNGAADYTISADRI